MENLVTIFHELKQILAAYSPPLISKVDDDAHFDLWSVKPVEIAGRKRTEVYFAGLILYKTYVGFYFMPIYVESKLSTVFKPELLSLRKGKSCFHIKKLDAPLVEQIKAALQAGFEIYKQNQWI